VAGELNAARSAGRPRDNLVGTLILTAARDLVVQHGYDGVTTEMIARAAGASKQTLYRRWPTKSDLVLDAFLEHAVMTVDQEMAADTHSVAQGLAGFLDRTFVALERTGPAIRSLMASAQGNSGFRIAFKTRFIDPRRRALTALLEDAITRGELPFGSDLEAAVIALYGAVWYRLLLDEPFDPSFSARVSRLVVGGLMDRNGG